MEPTSAPSDGDSLSSLHVENSSSRFSDAVEGGGMDAEGAGHFAHGFAFLEQA